MMGAHHLSWDNFRATVFVHGQKRVHRVLESPSIEMFGDGVANRIGIVLEIPPDTSIPPDVARLAFIRARTFKAKGNTFLEVATPVTFLHHQFYHFATAVAERVSVTSCTAVDAVRLELESFTDLMEEKSLLSIERQIGLLGELLFLERLLTRVGLIALDAWLGPMSEPHDFRIQRHEFEVKTTLAARRVHTIHGTEQLIASEGCTLSLVSILLGPPGATEGFSLAGKVRELRSGFKVLPAGENQFIASLEFCGYKMVDSDLYSRRYALRRPIAIVPVNKSFPAISRLGIQELLGPLAPRVGAIQYDVTVDGLEVEDGSMAFEDAVSGGKLGIAPR